MVYKLTMSTKILLVIFAIGTHVAVVSAQSGSDTCRACNCQFNNVQVLDQLIEEKIAAVLDSGTGKLYILQTFKQ